MNAESSLHRAPVQEKGWTTRTMIAVGILLGLWCTCAFFGPEKLGTYKVGSHSVTARRYEGRDRMVDVRWPRLPALDWVLQGWIVPGLQKTVVEYPMADSLSVQALNDSTIVLQLKYRERDEWVRKYEKGRITPAHIDTIILKWDVPVIQHVYQ